MKDEILNILEELCDTDEVREDLDLDLFDNGLLDSLGVVELLLKVEDGLGIQIQPTEITREDIKTPNKIIEYIEKKVGKNE